MAACVGCGFTVDGNGVLQHQFADGGGIECSDDPANPGLLTNGDVRPDVGCGLLSEPAGIRVATAGTWPLEYQATRATDDGSGNGATVTEPFACGDTGGAPIYCDSNGQLRTTPDHIVTRFRLTQQTEFGAAVAPGNEAETPQLVEQVPNPSDCRRAAILATFTVQWVWENDAGDNVIRMTHVRQVGGFVRSASTQTEYNNQRVIADSIATWERTETGFIAPGGTTTVSLQNQLQNRGNPADGTNNAMTPLICNVVVNGLIIV